MQSVRQSLILLSVLFLSGCWMLRRELTEPVQSQVIEVRGGDVITVRLAENATTGFRWKAECSDPDVRVTVEHRGAKDRSICGAPGEAVATIRVGSDFKDHEVVKLTYWRSFSGEVAREVNLGLFRRNGEAAAWR